MSNVDAEIEALMEVKIPLEENQVPLPMNVEEKD